VLSSAAALLDGLFERPVGGVLLGCYSRFPASLILVGLCALRFGQSLSSSCKDMVKHPLTDSGLKKFLADWEVQAKK